MSSFDAIFDMFGTDALASVHGEDVTYYDNARPSGVPLVAPAVHREKINVSDAGNSAHTRTIVEIRKTDLPDIDAATGRIKLARGDILGGDPDTEYTIAEIDGNVAGMWRVILA
ncbi:MAG: hypothetical protein COA96_16710 [SAR86 cluster bacterium]|uniref:Uncharacterized protein n=1 Tax=SAR86 cluster bacterium TaxID=2030880 RepID=A0A2A5AGP7_9GAMM|nr:MAG: hypothetical protein COA96_16710 [SAR86 cluster bacterium]